MVSWKTILGRKKIKQVTAYVVSIGGSNPPNPKLRKGKCMKDNSPENLRAPTVGADGRRLWSTQDRRSEDWILSENI